MSSYAGEYRNRKKLLYTYWRKHREAGRKKGELLSEKSRSIKEAGRNCCKKRKGKDKGRAKAAPGKRLAHPGVSNVGTQKKRGPICHPNMKKGEEMSDLNSLTRSKDRKEKEHDSFLDWKGAPESLLKGKMLPDGPSAGRGKGRKSKRRRVRRFHKKAIELAGSKVEPFQKKETGSPKARTTTEEGKRKKGTQLDQDRRRKKIKNTTPYPRKRGSSSFRKGVGAEIN